MHKPERRLIAVAIGATLFAMSLVGSFLSAFHQPQPNGLGVGVVGPPQLVQQLQSGLDQRMPGAFDIVSYPDENAARAGIYDRDVDGALVASSPRSATLITARAAGLFPTQTIEQTFTGLAAAGGMQLKVEDIAPLPAADRAGVKSFFILMGTLLPSIAIGVASVLVAGAASGRARAGGLILGSVLLALGVVLVADGLTGTMPGGYWKLAGITAMFSLAVSATTAALTRLHPAGALLAVLTFVIFGVPPTGGPARFFVPDFFKIFDPALPTASVASALRNTAYFDGHDTATQLWVLAIWAVGGLLGVVLTGRMRGAGHRAYPTSERAGATRSDAIAT